MWSSKSFKQAGFSLVQVMVAAAMMGGLAMVSMQLMENIGKSNKFVETKSDEIEMRAMVRLILSNEKFCRVSLAGEGPIGSPSSPVTFEKEDIDGTSDTEGLEVELFYASQDGESRTQKKLSASDDSFNKYGDLNIQSLFLLMNNGTYGNYSQSSLASDMGELVIQGQKNVQRNPIDFTFRFPLSVSFKTNSAGESTLLSCSMLENGKTVPSLNPSTTNWRFSTSYGPTGPTCPIGQFAIGMCSGGENKDCGTSQVTRLGCVSDTSGDYIPNNSYIVTKTGWYRDLVVCPPGHVITRFCSSGKNPDCSYGGKDFFTVIDCTPWSIGNSRQMRLEVHKYHATSSWGGNLTCLSGYYLTGVCTSGGDKDCSFHGQDLDNNYAKAIRCSKYIE